MARSHWKFKMKNNTLEMKTEPHVSKEDGKKRRKKNTQARFTRNFHSFVFGFGIGNHHKFLVIDNG